MWRPDCAAIGCPLASFVSTNFPLQFFWLRERFPASLSLLGSGEVWVMRLLFFIYEGDGERAACFVRTL